jgi:hypothetical protein
MKSWHKDLIALGIVVLLIVVVTSVFTPVEKTSTQTDIIILTESPAPPVCQDGETKDATCPDGVTTYLNENCVDGEWHQVMYIRNPCEPLPITEAPIVYADASSGHYKPGDDVMYKGVAGVIASGEIKDGGPLGNSVIIDDKEGVMLLQHVKVDNYEGYDEVEALKYPQEGDHGEVYLSIDGEQKATFEYHEQGTLELYIMAYNDPTSRPAQFFKRLD